jgi:hypothetical protein
MYEAVDDYAKGVPLFESAMDIGQHSLSAKHPDLHLGKRNLKVFD